MTISYISIALLATLEAYIDYRAIIRHKYINHTMEWIQRAVMAAIVLTILYLSKAFSQDITTLACILISTPPVFSIVHRLVLNKLRGRTYFYISPSNLYDLVWICIAHFINTKFKQLENPFDKTTMVVSRLIHNTDHTDLTSDYYKDMKLGGHLAYTVELIAVLTCFIVSLWALVWPSWN